MASELRGLTAESDAAAVPRGVMGGATFGLGGRTAGGPEGGDDVTGGAGRASFGGAVFGGALLGILFVGPGVLPNPLRVRTGTGGGAAFTGCFGDALAAGIGGSVDGGEDDKGFCAVCGLC